MADPRFLEPNEALAFVDLARDLHRGTLKPSPDIVRKKQEIELATRNLEQFFARTGEVNVGMVRSITTMKMELDALWIVWARSHAPGIIG